MNIVIKQEYFVKDRINNVRKFFIHYIFNKYIHLDFDCAEFGVYKGLTARMIIPKLESGQILYLFDSFLGLPDDWHSNFKKGTFRLSDVEIPTFTEENVILYKGLFKDTIPKFLEDHQTPLSFIHIDCDIYSSTKEVLFNLNKLIIPNTILIFDEYFGYAECVYHEAKALKEWCLQFKREIREICRTDFMQVAFKVIK